MLKIKIKNMLVLTVFIASVSCSKFTPRDTCVMQAMDEYINQIDTCEKKEMSYDECVSEYDIENKFEQKQKECRNVEDF